MKTTFWVLLVLATFFCKEEELNPPQDLFRDWKWALTTFDTRGKPLTAQGQDTTYYFKFYHNGVLELRDINRGLQEQRNFEVTGNDLFNFIEFTDSDITWG